ncbi:D-serine deaminase, pyridoxal phosphate-dependent [Singulisphaera sp. GP187]|uniref:D-TA family PLP-dependent enzyme n=1 Tax=Singulisphaera sp. GP187 TaxID=1882752 RepID=UPI0009263FC5|nr:D-TA family PLP-dependent enzyme [Singulisphaera sp. GP187]SIO66046.1 D-serine deaminase, pyridoxal phosphate-dependent [Singulisphaera sp. GP187]
MDSRYRLNETSRLLSPSLLIFRTILEQNLEAMIALAGSADRLRPHVKTHKMAEIVRLVERKGIHKHKCATIAEAEMIARAGGTDVLLGYPVVGPNIDRLARLIRGFPETQFRVLVDHPDSARALSAGVEGIGKPLPVLIDLEVGMGRTGIDPGAGAEELATLIERLPNLVLDGLHAYDGHIQEADPDERKRIAAPGIEKTLRLQERLKQRGIEAPRLVLGGTPTFPVHAALDRPGVECSPGTSVLHDNGYATKFPDLPFVPAALLLTRVISHPRPGRLCLDLGHKAVAADPVGARLTLLNIPEATLGGQSEEHLVVETPQAGQFPPGTAVLAIPTHICPTCALHRRVYVIEDGALVDEWDVTARDRSIGF